MAFPAEYARVRLGKHLHPVHQAVLTDLEAPGSKVYFRCGNEVGKTSSVAVSAILWHAEVIGGLTVSTAGAWRQIESQLVPCLKSHAYLFPGWRFQDTNIVDDRGVERYVGVSTKDQGYFQGFHNKPGMPLLMIIDEGAAVPEEIYQAAEDRCNPLRLLIMGSPLDPQGMFYRCGTDLARFYKQHRLTKLDCARSRGWWINDADIQRTIDKWGPEHPITLSTVYAEFSLTVEGALLSLREWEAAIESPPPFNTRNQHRHVFLDFAAGRDENVIAVAIGNRAWIEKGWREKNTMAAIGEFIATLNRLKREFGIKPEEVEGDADGMGIVFCDHLAEAGWPVLKFHGGGKPRTTPRNPQDQQYANLAAEVWTEGTNAIRRKEWILPNDQDLKGQLISRKTFRNSKGLLAVESKEDMASRGLASPDRADALLGALRPCLVRRAVQVMGIPGNPLPSGKHGFMTDFNDYGPPGGVDADYPPGAQC